jgi:hypothetical protein
MILTYKQKEELAKNYIASKQINFGNEVANHCAIEIYIAGLERFEELYNMMLQEFKDTYKWMFRFHCDETIKQLNEKQTG